MKDWKATCIKLLFPPVWLVMLLASAGTAGLIAVFMNSLENTPVSYFVYALSAYALTVLCAFFGKILPVWYKKTRQKVYDHPFGNRYMTDAAFKVQVSLYLSLAINLGYSLIKLVSGFLLSSLWMGAVAVYYILLSLLRFILLRYMHTGKEKQGLISEYRRYRLCGLLLLVLNLSLSGIVFQMVWQNKGYTYPGTLIFVAAAYTFYTVTVSVIDIVKYRKYNSPIISASKAIRFAAALVSLLSLETAMLAQFGDDEAFRRLMTALTGTGVCLIVLAMSTYMIVHSGNELKTLQNETPDR